jgi:hypothetical protein
LKNAGEKFKILGEDKICDNFQNLFEIRLISIMFQNIIFINYLGQQWPTQIGTRANFFCQIVMMKAKK